LTPQFGIMIPQLLWASLKIAEIMEFRKRDRC